MLKQKCWAKRPPQSGSESPEVLTTDFSGDWSDCSWSSLQGRVTDLKSAYKQVAVSPCDKHLSVIAVANPNREVKLFRAFSLMFGETAAVYAFLRLSRALAHLATALFDLVLIEYFDDFSQLAPAALASSSQECLEWIFGVLGWEIAMEEKKRKCFDPVFVSLGVQIDLREAPSGTIRIENKPGRVKSLTEVVEAFGKGCNKVTKAELQSVEGKLRYAG